MSRLIVLSNRVSLPNPDKVTAGGLAVALQDALTDIGGVWLGWNGEKLKIISSHILIKPNIKVWNTLLAL